MKMLFQPLLLLALSGCAGTVLRPEVERAATRAALQAALDHEGLAQPPRGDALELELVEPDAAQQAMMPIREPAEQTRPAAEAAPKTSEDGAGDAQRSVAASMQGETSPAVARALEDMTREMTEQRMLMMMQMMSGRGQAPVVVDDSGRMTDLAVAVQRLQDAQQQQADDTAALLEGLASLQEAVEARVPEDNVERMQTMEQSIASLPPALEDIRRAQDVLRERIERLESLHDATNDVAPLTAPAPQEAPPVLIPLNMEDDEQDDIVEEVPTDALGPDDASTGEEPGSEEPSGSEEEPSSDRAARRSVRRDRRAERFGVAQEQRDARAAARERELSAAYATSAAPAANPEEADDRSVVVVPIPARQTLPDDTMPCLPADTDYVRFPLDERAVARLERLQARGAYSTDPPDPVELPPATLCTDAP